MTVSNGELGNWQVTLVCDRTSPLDTLGMLVFRIGLSVVLNHPKQYELPFFYSVTQSKAIHIIGLSL